jgi:hypothetical protein
MHISDVIEQETAKLKLTNIGVLEYSIAGSLVWKSSEPRAYNETIQSKAMLYSPKFTPLIQCGDLSLSLIPLSIKRSKLLHWTYVSGFEPRCTSKPDCPISEVSKLATGGIVILFSENRKYRAALLHNGDLIVINKQSEKPGSHVLKEEIESSLLTKLCSLT